jgi:putative RNA 2'-phosphotransferase
MSSIGQGKRLSWLLRHGAISSNLTMDGAGWASIADVLAFLEITRDELDEIVLTNNKSRLQVDGDRVRCSQGHSDGTPANQDDLEASWEHLEAQADFIYHGTNLKALDEIKQEGLKPMGRTHVHLAEERDSKVGKRANVAVLLVIDPALLEGHNIGLFRSSNGVLLTRSVPPDCIVGIEPLTKRARRELNDVRGLLGEFG